MILLSTVNDLLCNSKLWTKMYKCKYSFTINVVPQGTIASLYLGITLCDTVCQTILPITLLLFLPIYIMYEKTMKGKIQFSYTQPKRQSKTLLSHIGLRRREVWPINSLGYQRTIHL